MNASRLLYFLLVAIGFFVIPGGVFAQGASTEYQPNPGEPGKDVGWIPTEQAVVDVMLDMAKVMSQDYVIDLGSGDGRVVITAAKRGARALGVEYNPDMVTLSKRNAARENVTDKTEFVQGDLFETDFSNATVVALFLRTDLNLKLRPRILDMKPGVRVVSNSFPMGEWAPEQTETVERAKCANLCCTAYFWIVPAKVEGLWKLEQGELRLRQSFQIISGTHSSNGTTVPVSGRLRGGEINFTVGSAVYMGRVEGNAMEGQVMSGGGTMKWEATRIDGN